MGNTYRKQLPKDPAKARKMLEQPGLDAFFTILYEEYDGVPVVPTLVKVFTNNIVTGSCSVTEFMRLVGVPAPFVKGPRFRRISVNHLYEAYKLFITNQ